MATCAVKHYLNMVLTLFSPLFDVKSVSFEPGASRSSISEPSFEAHAHLLSFIILNFF